MRELFINYSDSTKTSLVFETEEGDEFFVAVTEELESIINGSSDSGSHFGLSSITPLTAAPTAAESENGSEEQNRSDVRDNAEATDGEDEQESAGVSELHATDADEDIVDAEIVEDTETDQRPMTAPHGPRPVNKPAAESGSRPYSDAMSMRPAEIQARVRAGASAADLAEEMGVAESRVEPFAYPVMLERNNMADLAKQAHPVREDGPAKLTLWEILATAFAARGHSLSDAEWTAYREQAQPWVIKVTWTAGLSENEALWTFKQSMSSPSTVEARNSVAADLTDPDFVQPVRTLTSIGRGSRYDEAIDGPADARPRLASVNEDYDAAEALEREREREMEESGVYDQEVDMTSEDNPAEKQRGDESEKDSAGTADSAESSDSEDPEFLQHPDPEKKPTKRRRKAVTPHWEDVLLGVRANTKRPRS